MCLSRVKENKDKKKKKKKKARARKKKEYYQTKSKEKNKKEKERKKYYTTNTRFAPRPLFFFSLLSLPQQGKFYLLFT